MEHVNNPHDDVLVITIDINEFDMKRVLVDLRNLTTVLFVDDVFTIWKTKKNLKKKKMK